MKEAKNESREFQKQFNFLNQICLFEAILILTFKYIVISLVFYLFYGISLIKSESIILTHFKLLLLLSLYLHSSSLMFTEYFKVSSFFLLWRELVKTPNKILEQLFLRTLSYILLYSYFVPL